MTRFYKGTGRKPKKANVGDLIFIKSENEDFYVFQIKEVEERYFFHFTRDDDIEEAQSWPETDELYKIIKVKNAISKSKKS